MSSLTSNNNFTFGQPISMAQNNQFGNSSLTGNNQNLNLGYNIAMNLGPGANQALPSFGGVQQMANSNYSPMPQYLIYPPQVPQYAPEPQYAAPPAPQYTAPPQYSPQTNSLAGLYNFVPTSAPSAPASPPVAYQPIYIPAPVAAPAPQQSLPAQPASNPAAANLMPIIFLLLNNNQISNNITMNPPVTPPAPPQANTSGRSPETQMMLGMLLIAALMKAQAHGSPQAN